MDWDCLFADLESRFIAERRAEVTAEAVELAQAEMASITLLARLRAREGKLLHLRTRSGQSVDGLLKEACEHYLLIDEGKGTDALVPLNALALVGPLAGTAVPDSDSRVRRTLGSVLREMAAQGMRVRVVAAGVDTVGKIVRVGADHLDIMPAGAQGSAARVSILFNGIDVVRSR